MFSLARNERGIRLASAAIILLPIVSLICANSHSSIVDAVALFFYVVFAAIAFIALLYEKAEEEEDNKR